MSESEKSNARLGWVKGRPDRRDMFYSAARSTLTAIPARIDLEESGLLPPVYDQGMLGSCTANAYATMYRYVRLKLGIEDTDLSRLFLYYESRKVLGTLDSDSGAIIRDVLKVGAQVGVSREKHWPYEISKFRDTPIKKAYKNALKHQGLIYLRVIQSISQIKSCLAEGFPFEFGFTVYESFDSIGSDGIMPFPKDNEKDIGGHAVVGIGYDDATGRVKCRNSWDKSWGKDGNFFMPYSIIVDPNMSDDFWTLRQVE